MFLHVHVCVCKKLFTMDTKIGQINLRKSKAAMEELGRRKYDIACVQEPYGYKQNVPKLGNFKEVHYCTSLGIGERPRTCIYTNIDCWKVDEFTGGDVSTIAITVDNKKTMYIASVYLDITKPVEQTMVVKMINRCRALKMALVICMDSNAHSSLWGSNSSNKRGEELEELLLEHELFVANVGNVSTFDNDRSKSIIDITVYNRWATDIIDEWRVDEGPSISDQRYIDFKITNYKPFRKEMRNLRKADWMKFKEMVGKVTPEPRSNFNTKEGLDREADRLNDIIKEGLDVVCPLKGALNRRPCRWWTPDLENLRQEQFAASADRNKNALALIRFKRTRAIYKSYEPRLRAGVNLCNKPNL